MPNQDLSRYYLEFVDYMYKLYKQTIEDAVFMENIKIPMKQ